MTPADKMADLGQNAANDDEFPELDLGSDVSALDDQITFLMLNGGIFLLSLSILGIWFATGTIGLIMAVTALRTLRQKAKS